MQTFGHLFGLIWALLSQWEWIYGPKLSFVHISYDLHIWPRNIVQGLFKHLLKYEPNKTKGKESMLWTKIFILTWSDLTLNLLEPLFKITAHIFWRKALWVKYESDWIYEHEYMIQTNSAVIITLDLETWLKITAHPSIKRHLVREI